MSDFQRAAVSCLMTRRFPLLLTEAAELTHTSRHERYRWTPVALTSTSHGGENGLSCSRNGSLENGTETLTGLNEVGITWSEVTVFNHGLFP